MTLTMILTMTLTLTHSVTRHTNDTDNDLDNDTDTLYDHDTDTDTDGSHSHYTTFQTMLEHFNESKHCKFPLKCCKVSVNSYSLTTGDASCHQPAAFANL